MNNFEKFKSMTIDELADWIDKYGQFDNSPWLEYFNTKYCENCESIKCTRNEKTDLCAYCELHDCCKFFPDLNYVPEVRDTIKLWLESEAKENQKGCSTNG